MNLFDVDGRNLQFVLDKAVEVSLERARNERLLLTASSPALFPFMDWLTISPYHWEACGTKAEILFKYVSKGAGLGKVPGVQVDTFLCH